MKKFVYQVAGYEFVDTEAFGKAWREAKVKAAELHVGIYRLVIKGEDWRQDVYVTGGCFLGVNYAKPEDVYIF